MAGLRLEIGPAFVKPNFFRKRAPYVLANFKQVAGLVSLQLNYFVFNKRDKELENRAHLVTALGKAIASGSPESITLKDIGDFPSFVLHECLNFFKDMDLIIVLHLDWKKCEIDFVPWFLEAAKASCKICLNLFESERGDIKEYGVLASHLASLLEQVRDHSNETDGEKLIIEISRANKVQPEALKIAAGEDILFKNLTFKSEFAFRHFGLLGAYWPLKLTSLSLKKLTFFRFGQNLSRLEVSLPLNASSPLVEDQTEIRTLMLNPKEETRAILFVSLKGHIGGLHRKSFVRFAYAHLIAQDGDISQLSLFAPVSMWKNFIAKNKNGYLYFNRMLKDFPKDQRNLIQYCSRQGLITLFV